MRALIVLLCLSVLHFAGCNGCEHTSTVSIPSLENLTLRKSYLKVTDAPVDAPIATTQTQISNVSPGLAVAKLSQALESAPGNLPYRLSTVFHIANTDKSEGEHGGPAVTRVVVEGHLYYIAFLDYPAEQMNRAAYEQTNRRIPAIGVVDAEDETKPAWIRTTDAKGKAYEIQIYLGDQASTTDPNNIYRFLRNHGYYTYGSHRLDSPTLEVDDEWRPYFTVTYCNDGNYGGFGYNWYANSLLIVDPQAVSIVEYHLDDPNTKDKDERDPKIPAWVDQIYSPKLIVQWANDWAYNLDNYGKTSELNRFVVDSSEVDEVMNAANTNLVFVLYFTSTLPDNSTIGVMLVDPRTGEGTYYATHGPLRAMAVKSAAENVIKQAVVRFSLEVEDLTLHTIYGVPTWEGILTHPAFQNSGGLKHDQAERYGSLYAGTVLLQANHDLQTANVVWANSKLDAFTKYEQHLYLRKTQRVGSNDLKEKELKAVVETIHTLVVDGFSHYLIRLVGHPGEVYDIPIQYLGDPNNEDATVVATGDQVFLKYADLRNRKSFTVREFHRLQ